MIETPITPGARTANEPDEATAAANVQTLFNTIAPSYDRLNHLLSFGLDRHWWRSTARTFSSILKNPEARILDICCGTGDMTAALLAERPPQSSPGAPCPDSRTRVSTTARVAHSSRPHRDEWGTSEVEPSTVQPVTGLDFSAEMLTRARTKYATANALWIEGDAMHLPFADASLDLVTAAFGFRNLTNYAEALTEIHRVLRPGGQLGILECNHPEGLSGAFYNLYLHHGLPLIGGWISGQRAAYAYLPASIARFPRPPRMKQMLTEAGFANPTWRGYFMHAAGLYRATKP
jgi:demethylmenaquinone methyltransferase / 2-methoxy-6-polyprenyl-1,4-benzoquinol methylase